MANQERFAARLTLYVVAVATLLGCNSSAAWAGVSEAAASDAERVAYRISATYDTAGHLIDGRQTIRWTNRTPHSTAELQFHLYLNAFANSRSSFMRETGRRWDEWLEHDPDAWGYTVVRSLRVGSDELAGRIQFIHPDDDNGDDRTVGQVQLPTAVRPGESVEIEIAFTSKLPRLFARSGYAGPFAMVAQWFPKLGVFEDGHWVCHQYHSTTEFYADFGTYDVELTVPVDAVVGSTGTVRDERNNGNGTRTLRMAAENVHDFAWVIDPRFRVLERLIDGVNVRLLLQPNHMAQVRRHFGASTAAIRWYHENIGRYPYPQLTVVDPAPGAAAAGGMEYPTLITVGTRAWMPAGVRLPETILVHEFGHQYWYGMVASNEAEEAWLDEGVNTYVEGLIMDETYGPGSYFDLFGLQINAVAVLRAEYLRAAQHDPLSTRAWEYLSSRSYHAISYAKTALMLRTFAAVLGDDTVARALRTYFERWRFGAPRGADFWRILAEASGGRSDNLQAQLATGTGVVDYAATRVSVEEDSPFTGYPISNAGPGTPIPDDGDSTERRGYRSEVVIERLGEVRLPVSIQVAFEDGSIVTEQWDGEARWRRFEYAGPQRVEWANVDPDRKLALDINWINNSRMRSGGTRGLIRLASTWAFWLQNVVHVLSGI